MSTPNLLPPRSPQTRIIISNQQFSAAGAGSSGARRCFSLPERGTDFLCFFAGLNLFFLLSSDKIASDKHKSQVQVFLYFQDEV